LFCWLGQPSYKSEADSIACWNTRWYWLMVLYCYIYTKFIRFIFTRCFYIFSEFQTISSFMKHMKTSLLSHQLNKIMITVEMLRKILFCFHIQSDIFLKAVTILLYSHNNIQENVNWLWLVGFRTFNPKQQCKNL
jgi:hypothetical protein